MLKSLCIPINPTWLLTAQCQGTGPKIGELELDCVGSGDHQSALACVGYGFECDISYSKKLPTAIWIRLANPNEMLPFPLFFAFFLYTYVVLHRSIDRDPKSAGWLLCIRIECLALVLALSFQFQRPFKFLVVKTQTKVGRKMSYRPVIAVSQVVKWGSNYVFLVNKLFMTSLFTFMAFTQFPAQSIDDSARWSLM